MLQKIVLSLFFIVSLLLGYAQQRDVSLKDGKIVLDFSRSLDGVNKSKTYTIKRASSRFGHYKTIGKTTKSIFTDNKVVENPYNYYYQICVDDRLVVLLGLEIELFGANTFIYSASDDPSKIGEEVNALHERMFGKEFSPNRYGIFFKKGDYRASGLLKVPFYVQIAGLGHTPYDVQLSNIHTPPHLADGNGTCTFWRSAENLSVIGPETYVEEETFKWAVSQAAPLRRIYSTRVVRNQWGNGWVSGGYTADCYFESAAGSKNQQQWYTRNSYLGKGRGNFEEIKYNYCFQGVEFSPSVDQASYTNNWDKGGNVTVLPHTPIIREKPFLFFDQDQRYKVFRPALKRNHIGVSYAAGDMGEGEVIDVLDDFYVVKPGVDAVEINRQLARGKHLLFTPGMYELSESLQVTRPNTIVLGLGLATLIPGKENGTTAITVADVDGVTVASLMFDAHYSSQSLLQVGTEKTADRHAENPTLLADLFFSCRWI